MPVGIVDVCPTCGSNRIRQGSKDKALIAWGVHGSGVVMEFTKDGILASQIDSMSDWVDEVFGGMDDTPEECLQVWEGFILVNEDGERVHKGKLRDLTDEEWGCLREGASLW
ncbi:MAG: hypothetical protein ACXADB_05560 [Candidatus Hermodarchaeia archaeon]|jgi:hypothetical protein